MTLLPRGGRARLLLRGSDMALAYAAVVLAVGVWMLSLPAVRRTQVVLECSTNTTNLRHYPVRVLVLSAVVVDGWPALLLLVPLVVAVTVSTRWVGRRATAVALVFGHVFATLFIAVLIAAGVHAQLLDRAVTRAADVGTSYALFGVLGLLVGRWSGKWRAAYVTGVLLLLAVLVAGERDFTEAGHAAAFAIGAALAVVALAGARAVLGSTGAPTSTRMSTHGGTATADDVRPRPGPSPAAPAPPRRPAGDRDA